METIQQLVVLRAVFGARRRRVVSSLGRRDGWCLLLLRLAASWVRRERHIGGGGRDGEFRQLKRVGRLRAGGADAEVVVCGKFDLR